jgi:hypothetical protein
VSIAPAKAQTYSGKQKPEEGFVGKTIGDPVAAYTLLLAVITGLLCYATWRLYRTTVELAKDAKDTGDAQADKMERSIEAATKAAEAMQSIACSTEANSVQLIESLSLSRKAMRARISVIINRAAYQAENLNFDASPQVINRGATEARDVRWKMAAAILPLPLPDDFKYPLPADYSGGAAIGSQGDGIISAIVPYRVAPNEVEKIKSLNGSGLFVWGFVVYRDIFGKRHFTTFCHLMHWRQIAKKPLLRRTPKAPVGTYFGRHNRST